MPNYSWHTYLSKMLQFVQTMPILSLSDKWSGYWTWTFRSKIWRPVPASPRKKIDSRNKDKKYLPLDKNWINRSVFTKLELFRNICISMVGWKINEFKNNSIRFRTNTDRALEDFFFVLLVKINKNNENVGRQCALWHACSINLSFRHQQKTM